MELDRSGIDIGLVTADATRARHFYAKVMRYAEEDPARIAEGITRFRFRVGDQRIDLIDLSDTPPRQPSGLYDGIGYRVVAHLVEDLGALIERIEAHGGRVAPGVDLPSKLRICFAKDADGNMLELIGVHASGDRGARAEIQVGLTVADVERSRHFYGHVLGLPEDPSVPMPGRMTRYAYSVGSSTLKFWSRSESLPNLAGPIQARVGIRVVTIWVRGLDELAKELEARGADLVRPATQRPDARNFFVSDPDGNRIEFAEQTR